MTEIQKRTEVIALFLMEEFGLTQDGWTFKWNNRKSAAGVCCYTSKTIQMSKAHAEARDEENTLNTIKHEMAHALTPITYSRTGRRNSHGAAWKNKMRELGGNPSRTFSMSVEERERFDSSTVVNTAPRYVVCHMDTGEIFQTMKRRMSWKRQARLSGMFIRGRRSTTIGKLKLMTVESHRSSFAGA